MRWQDIGRSRNLQDRRAGPTPRGAGIPLGIGGTLILLVLSLLFGTDLFSLLGITPGVSPTPQSTPPSAEANAAEEPQVRFVSFVLDDVQATWTKIFSDNGLDYQDATLVLYRQAVESACGVAPSSVGPFYCPRDGDVYLDLSFYDDLTARYGAPGDFAQAYVIAHELGHHVQNLLGTADEVRQAQANRPEAANALSVAMELQADCFAGVWAATTQGRGLLEAGDVQEALGAAAAVGDDRLQKRGGGSVQPDSFTHGSSESRMHWFQVGMDSGDPASCDTFAAAAN